MENTKVSLINKIEQEEHKNREIKNENLTKLIEYLPQNIVISSHHCQYTRAIN